MGRDDHDPSRLPQESPTREEPAHGWAQEKAAARAQKRSDADARRKARYSRRLLGDSCIHRDDQECKDAKAALERPACELDFRYLLTLRAELLLLQGAHEEDGLESCRQIGCVGRGRKSFSEIREGEICETGQELTGQG